MKSLAVEKSSQNPKHSKIDVIWSEEWKCSKLTLCRIKIYGPKYGPPPIIDGKENVR
jgi:hypothetical protein